MVKGIYLTGASLLVAFVLGCANTLAKTLQRYDFRELRPPSRLVPPGTIVSLPDAGSARPRIICERAAALGPDFEAPFSPTADLKLTRDVTKELGIDGDYLSDLRTKAGYQSIKSIRLQLSNVYVAQVSWDRVVGAVLKRQRRAECWDAMELAHSEDVPMSMVEAVIRADVRFSVEYRRDLVVGADRRQIAESLAADLGLVGVHLKSVGSEEIEGNGLFWGIRDDQRLLAPDTVGRGDTVYMSVRYLSLWKRRGILKANGGGWSSGPSHQCQGPTACPDRSSNVDDPLRKALRLLPRAPIQF